MAAAAAAVRRVAVACRFAKSRKKNRRKTSPLPEKSGAFSYGKDQRLQCANCYCSTGRPADPERAVWLCHDGCLSVPQVSQLPSAVPTIRLPSSESVRPFCPCGTIANADHSQRDSPPVPKCCVPDRSHAENQPKGHHQITQRTLYHLLFCFFRTISQLQNYNSYATLLLAFHRLVIHHVRSLGHHKWPLTGIHNQLNQSIER
jgi:hypothetical protein